MSDAELATILLGRAIRQEPVWVSSPVGQEVRIHLVGWDDGNLIAYDHEGNDRLVTDYLLEKPPPHFCIMSCDHEPFDSRPFASHQVRPDR